MRWLGMAEGMLGVALVGYALAALSYGGLAAYTLIAGRLQSPERRSTQLFVAAVVCSALWSLARTLALALQADSWALVASVLDLGRYALWFALLLSLLSAAPGLLAANGPAAASTAASAPPAAPAPPWMRRSAFALLLSAAVPWLMWTSGQPVLAWPRLSIALVIALPIFGLLLIEQLFRNLGEDKRWNAKPVCLALCCVFVFDVYLFSEGVLFLRLDTDALNLRGIAHALAVPFLVVAIRRRANWMAKLQLSRTAAFYSVSLILAGAYLLFMAGVGYYVRFFGGEWGRALQQSLFVLGLALLAVLGLSAALRSRLRVFVGKHFFSYRYDYREEWLRFTALLSSQRSAPEMGELIVRGLAKLVECPAGALWTQDGAQTNFVQVASWQMRWINEPESVDSALCRFLRTHGWVVDMDEFRSGPRRYEGLALPTWLLGTPDVWLVVPLLAGDDLLGFVVLKRPLTPIQLNWEVLDLLKTAGRQAAGYLAQMQATEALLEARKFEAFNRMSAFVVHDLKNIVAQLSLMLKNAERLHDNREFQQDMLLTVEGSLEKMRRLMLQLREGARPPGGTHGVELGPILRRLQAMAKAQGRSVELDGGERLATRGHEDRLERVLGHFVQNALDATPAAGRVSVQAARVSGQLRVIVQDDGAGMSDDFVRNRLFKPFNTTKQSGMGIGSYESLQYLRELGGRDRKSVV